MARDPADEPAVLRYARLYAHYEPGYCRMGHVDVTRDPCLVQMQPPTA